MRILITGAGGNLGCGLTALLEGKHKLRLADIAPLDTPHEFVTLDVRNGEQYLAAAQGVDLIVHTPAWHGIHLREHQEREFWELNVDGSFNLFQAAVANKVPRMIWISSMSVFNRDNIYGFTKVVGEDMCRFYHEVHGIKIVLLRPADFTPYRSRKQYGERLLRGGVDREDVYQITALAVERGDIDYAAYPVMRADPWTPEELALWPGDHLAVLEHYVPNARDLVARYDLQLPDKISVPDIAISQTKLGYNPQHNFVSFLRDLAAHDQAGDAQEWLAGV